MNITQEHQADCHVWSGEKKAGERDKRIFEELMGGISHIKENHQSTYPIN